MTAGRLFSVDALSLPGKELGFMSGTTTLAGQPPRPDEVKTRKVEMVLQQLDTLPTLPAIAMRLMSLTGTAESKIEEVVQLLSADQSLTGKLLSLASSAMLGARSPITTVQQAVVRLGFDTVRNLVLSGKVFEAFQQRPV